ncbi:MAG: hypothetical protein P4L50_09145 [Anaerolineaceae bacterium]|nr:hypothetical protein [Anaerolineaceae bacterium]
MSDELLLSIWRYLLPVPQPIWRKEISGRTGSISASLSFMQPDHHRVHNFVVRELPKVGKPLPAGLIAQELDMPVERVVVILDDLESHMTFLYRNNQGAVSWAYPVTVERTPHRLTFSSGELLYAA